MISNAKKNQSRQKLFNIICNFNKSHIERNKSVNCQHSVHTLWNHNSKYCAPTPTPPPPTQSGISKTGNMILKNIHIHYLYLYIIKNIYLPVIATESISNRKILTDMVDFNGQVFLSSMSFMHNKFPRIV